MIWTDKQLKEALSVDIPDHGRLYRKVQFNSKDIQKDDIFIALSGNRDGHEFVQDALARGAACSIISKDISEIDNKKLVKVKDTRKALDQLARYKREESNAKFIAITGSVGKTSTKEALKKVLTAYGKTYASHGTFNNELGVSLTLSSIPDDADYAIIEMGMNAKGEISPLSKDVRPDIAIITTVSEGHIEFFNSVEEIADAKCEIFDGMNPKTGIAIINRDMDVYQHCVNNIKNHSKLENVKTFGIHEESDVKLVSHEMLGNDNTRLVYQLKGEEIELTINDIIPTHLAENLASIFAVLTALNLNIEDSFSVMSQIEAIKGRGKIEEIMHNGKSYKIVCDYYNSNPQSLKASLLHLAQFENNKKIAILGDMGELGKNSLALHEKMVSYIEDSGVSMVFLVGKFMSHLKNSFKDDLLVKCYDDVNQLIDSIDDYIKGGEMILMKGSRSRRLDKLAKHLGVCDVL